MDDLEVSSATLPVLYKLWRVFSSDSWALCLVSVITVGVNVIDIRILLQLFNIAVTASNLSVKSCFVGIDLEDGESLAYDGSNSFCAETNVAAVITAAGRAVQ